MMSINRLIKISERILDSEKPWVSHAVHGFTVEYRHVFHQAPALAAGECRAKNLPMPNAYRLIAAIASITLLNQ